MWQVGGLGKQFNGEKERARAVGTNSLFNFNAKPSNSESHSAGWGSVQNASSWQVK